MPDNILKNIRYISEYTLLRTAFFLFKLMPAAWASGLGGWIGSQVGPKLATSRKALRNLQQALPGKTDDEYALIIKGMWNNLGRVMGEYPHLEHIARNVVEIGNPHILENLRDDGREALLFGAHLANWELSGIAFLARGLETHAVVRAPNNPLTARLMERQRSLNGQIGTIAKSSAGARQIMKYLKEGRHVGILIDQKYNEGIPASFFGLPAMTSPAFVELAQRFKCPLVPVRFERLDGIRLRLTFYEPLPVFDEKGNKRDVSECVADAHRMLEQWISERPEQWIWLHRRWKSEANGLDRA